MMIEAYAFLAAFVTQILAMSVLLPAWFTRYVRARLVSFPAERLAQLYPGIDIGHAQERFLAQYRALNTAVALLGLLFLGWFFSYMQRPEWDEGKVNMLVTLYLFLQAAQWGFVIWFAVRFKIAWFGIRFNALHERALLESKRKAVLQRRGLFDLVSPFAVFLTALVYLLFVAFVIYIQQHPFRGFAGAPGNIGIITLLYAWNAFMVYRFLHGKKINPLETQAEHLHLIGLYVKTHVYGCIAVVFFLSLGFAFKLFDLEKWGPFGHSVFFVILTLITCMTLILPPRNNQQPEVQIC